MWQPESKAPPWPFVSLAMLRKNANQAVGAGAVVGLIWQLVDLNVGDILFDTTLNAFRVPLYMVCEFTIAITWITPGAGTKSLYIEDSTNGGVAWTPRAADHLIGTAAQQVLCWRDTPGFRGNDPLLFRAAVVNSVAGSSVGSAASAVSTFTAKQIMVL